MIGNPFRSEPATRRESMPIVLTPHRMLRKVILCLGMGFVFLLTAGCGGGGGGNQGGRGEPNTLPIYLGAAGDNTVCGNFINAPCTDVTICSSLGINCQTISDMLVDTGSSGIRVFPSALNSPGNYSPITTGSGSPVGECARFGNGSYGDWGPLVKAQVTLGGEPAVAIPIQLIEPTYAGQYTSSGSPKASNPSCGSSFVPDTSPTQAGYNGILGVGLGIHWCGSLCATKTNSFYFACPSTTCSPTTLSESSQDQNPVASLPNGDDNGVVISLPSPVATESSSLTGTLILGIGTESNNTPSSGVTAYPAATNFTFDTKFKGVTYTPSSSSKNFAFIDSGSPAYYFTDSLSNCSSPNTSTYCPASPVSLSAEIAGDGGSPYATIDFSIAAPSFQYPVIGTIGIQGGGFDWGLPFFFGRDVYVGINTKPSMGTTGPFWAF
ncbi:MAG: DUF3443 family protein [Leptospirales bacterium]